ncbi:unnamed protein product [Effrenium voratum]|uniref:UBC core domain-containing protein n=1 Tax=Effrenium voratum TaxID=2562239 RepID=A0AA36HS62_9DINO|nr:unnamed protein product [Effrenium voratum]|mmetsp:Transcript_48393/g.115283  ORF Transcript_48393/g.115283 Transcript_48393/m.115283 type:complete len:299 (+) Transcript_48393:40-936(+)
MHAEEWEARPSPPTGSSSSTSSIKRIQRELKEISQQPSRHWTAGPAKDDLFEWIFAIRGPPETDFQGGIYTGKIVLPVNYPLAPPSITMLTPSGRWEVGKKICLSNTNYHAELWQPAWGIRTMMEALRSHFPAAGDGAIGALDWPSDQRKRLAQDSLDFVTLPNSSGQWSKKNRELLPELSPEELKEELPEKPVAPVESTEVLPAARQAPPRADTPGPEPRVAPKAAPRRRREGDRQQRQQNVVVQLLKPPSTGRGRLLMSLNLLIGLVLVSFSVVLMDVVRSPPSLLNPPPDQKVKK